MTLIDRISEHIDSSYEGRCLRRYSTRSKQLGLHCSPHYCSHLKSRLFRLYYTAGATNTTNRLLIDTNCAMAVALVPIHPTAKLLVVE